MLTDTDELETAWRALAGQKADKGWLTVALGHSSPRFRGGIVFPEGGETLLVGFNVGSELRKADLPEGTGFRVEISKESFSAGFSTWLCLTRQSGAGRDLFVQMAADIVSALSRTTTQSDSWLLSLMLARIRAWQEFMRKPRTDLLRPEEELGLFGELTFMREAIAGGASVADVVHAWSGPSRSLQDFQTAVIGVEVKATLSVKTFSAHISSLEQLDGMKERAVLLAAIRFSLHDAGQTLPELISAMRQLAADGDVLSTLNRTLMLSGFVDEASELYKRRFIPLNIRLFEVNEAFPALGPVDKVWQPYLCGCQGEECREGFSCLVVSGRDAPELLETVEHPLDAVSIFVNPKVAGRRVLSVGFWRNDRPDTVDQEFFTQEVTVVAFVGEEQPRLADRYRQQVRNGVVVRSLAACQDEAKRAALTVCSGVDFRRKAAA